MDELFVPVNDLAKFSDERYGNDIRRLQQNGPCPCILHSYSFGLTACPCGCRHFPFSEIRLRQAGLRGFFVVDEATGRNRYLHVKEAALLCTLDPLMNFGASSKDGLCLIGQIAAPIQALWVGTYLLESLGLFAFPRETILQTYKWHLLRRATYAWPTPGTDQFRLYDAHEQNWVTVVVDTPSTLSSILLAEHRLQHEAMILKIQDPWEVLPPTAFASPSSSTGPLSLLRKAKRQRIERAHEQIVHQVPVWSNDDLQLHHITLPSGSFVFELFAAIDCLVQVDSILDVNQIEWRADDRLWKPVVIASYASRCTPRVTAQGPTTTGGLSDVGLDGAACRVMACSGQPRVFWVPAATSTSLLHQTRWQNSDGHPYLGALHGSVFTAIAMEDHWLLVELKVKGTKLHVSSWTGMDINDDSLLCTMIGRICHSLALQGYVLHRHFWITQQLPHTCGAVVILHLGCRLKLWTLRFHPTEEDMYIYIRHQFPDPGTYTAKGKTSLSNPEQDVVWQLRDMLKAKGVDDSRTEERALAAIAKIGLPRIQEALQAKQPWTALKSLGSAPKVNFMWIKPDELERQIRARATSKFHIGKSNKKQSGNKPRPMPTTVDPELLDLIQDTFMTEDGNPLLPIAMSQVGSDRAGLAFGTVAQVLPFLKEGVSLSLDALGVLTTSPIPVESHGLLPVTAIRFPAIYKPTQEPILVDGSLVQLGDLTIVRHRDNNLVPLEAIATGTLKIAIYRDEWQDDWQEFVSSPMKKVTERFPKLVLCKGQRCGGQCDKFHPPVDAELDGVILDLWSRSWQTLKGKRATPLEADQFQVLIRVPQLCMNVLQSYSGTAGYYAEPRRDDGRGPAEGSMVIWVPNGTLDDAMLKSRTIERVLAICRFGNKYGVRVSQKDAETTHAKINPDVPFQDYQIQMIYEIRPLPHGTQRVGVVQLLKKWQWKARPLQPYHSDQQGMGWLVGTAVAPPAMLFPTEQGDVTVVLHRKVSAEPSGPKVLSTMKTRSHMKQKATNDQATQNDKPNKVGPPPGLSDPWANWKDPWARSATHPSSGDVSMAATSRIDQLEERVSQNLQQQLLKAPQEGLEEKHEARFQKLEVDISELRQQRTRYESWFQEAATASNSMQSQIGELRSQVRENATELVTVRSEIQNGFQNLEALFAKKHRTE